MTFLFAELSVRNRQLVRTEQSYSGAWVDDNHVKYQWDSREYQESEEREDYSGGWSTRYDVTQEYDMNGQA